MKTPPLLLATMALAVAAACAAPELREAPPEPAPPWNDTGTPPATVGVQEREVRYYRDETGAIWDDRGRKVSAGP